MKKTLIQCVLAVLVIVIGIIITVKFIRLCQKLFPDTPPNPDPTNVVKAAWFVAGPTRAGAAPNAPMTPTEDMCDFSFSCLLTEQGLCLTNWAVPGTVTGDVLTAELSAYGLSPTRTSYGSNTSPSDITYAGGTISVGDGVTVVLEESLGGGDWAPVLTNSFRAGQQLNLTLPVPCKSNAFFRAVKL